MSWRRIITMFSLLSLVGCSTHPPIRTANQVDLQRFMGDWYVIANIPTRFEKGAHNAVESYSLRSDGTVTTTFSFRKGGFGGEKKTWHLRGYVVDKQSNAVWGMQFIWPFKADYRILYVSPDYSQTVIGRLKRDYVWIMARTPGIAPADYKMLLGIIEAEGYDTDRIEPVPQQWPAEDVEPGLKKAS